MRPRGGWGRRDWDGMGQDGGSEDKPLGPIPHGFEIGYVKGLARDLVGAVLGDQRVESVLAATDGDNEDAAGDTRRGARDEDGLVWERHAPG
jgi:hypothetical protein